MKPKTRNWREISWSEYCIWLTGKTIKEEESFGGTVLLTFSDASQAKIESHYHEEPGYSEYTPGWTSADLPTVEVSDE